MSDATCGLLPKLRGGLPEYSSLGFIIYMLHTFFCLCKIVHDFKNRKITKPGDQKGTSVPLMV